MIQIDDAALTVLTGLTAAQRRQALAWALRLPEPELLALLHRPGWTFSSGPASWTSPTARRR